MTPIACIQRGQARKPPRLLIYGTEGIGKSTLAAAAPDPVFVPTEDGLDRIDCHRFSLAASFGDVVANLSALRDEDHAYRTVVVDSLDWLERLIWDSICAAYNVKSIEKVDGGYGKGYTHALTPWRQVIDLLADLRDRRGMGVILIAHAKIEKFEDPESSAYDRYSPRLHKHATALLCEWCDAVLFAGRRVRTQTENVGFNRTRTIAAPIGAAGGDRILRCVGGPTCVAKNRFGINSDLPLDWQSLYPFLSSNGVKING